MRKGHVTPQIGLIGAVASGTTLEWFNAFLFAVGARYIASNFFPSKDPFASLINTFLAFALGFLQGLLEHYFSDGLGIKLVERRHCFGRLLWPEFLLSL